MPFYCSSLIFLNVDYHVRACASAGCAANAGCLIHDRCRVITFCVDLCLGKFNDSLGACSGTKAASLAEIFIDGYLYHFLLPLFYTIFPVSRVCKNRRKRDTPIWGGIRTSCGYSCPSRAAYKYRSRWADQYISDRGLRRGRYRAFPFFRSYS